MFKNLYSGIRSFQDNLVDGKPNEWRCRAGARYLYVCEEGLVHYCSQQRGYPGVPLESYTIADIRREFVTPKSCAPVLHGRLRPSRLDDGLLAEPSGTAPTSSRPSAVGSRLTAADGHAGIDPAGRPGGRTHLLSYGLKPGFSRRR